MLSKTSSNTQKLIKKYMNSNPHLFVVIAVHGGHCGNLLVRIIAGTDNRWFWTKNSARSVESIENSKPLDWPRNTEGYLIYDFDGWGKNKSNWSKYFKENHLASSHVGVCNIEYMSEKQFIEYVNEAKRLSKCMLLRTHNLEIHKELTNVPVIRVVGSLEELLDRKHSRYYLRNFTHIAPIFAKNVYNLNIGKLLNKNYDIFLDEYFNLCSKFNMYANANNVRAYILMWIERLHRATNSK
jgi:hypothetical protein